MIKVTNLARGQLVCDLSNGKTLRLNVRQSKELEDSLLTPHFKVLEQKRVIRCEVVKPTKTVTPVKEEKKETKKEVKENGK